jgi:very-short-patch-repair endonuclease
MTDNKIPFEKSFASHEKAIFWSDINKLKPSEVLKSSKKKFWFKCENSHLFECSRLSNITYLNQFCQECNKIKKNIKFSYNYDYLKHFCGNNNIELSRDYKSDKINRESIIEGRCLNGCIVNFKKTFRMLIKYGAYCDDCVKKNKGTKISIILREKNKSLPYECSLASHEKAVYFSDKNVDENGVLINTNHIPLGSHDKFIFKCDKCSHSFDISISHLSNGRWCPYCCIPQKKLCGEPDCIDCFEKSFASNIEKVKYYSNKNKEKPEFILKKGDKEVIFDCDVCNHSFTTRVKHIDSGIWCPYCAIPSKILCVSSSCKHCFEKSFASDERVIYWSSKNKLEPRQVFKKSNSNFIFNCDSCSRDFETNLSQNTGCPYCVNKTEKKLYDNIYIIYPNLIQQYRVEWCKNVNYLPYDFCIEEYKIIIELDGPQHFRQVSNWKSPEEQHENDKYKQNCANEKGYSIIRLLQEDVFYNKYDWKTELINNIEKIKTDNIIQNIYMCKNNEYENFTN